MENYFWVATQSHFFTGEESKNGYRLQHTREPIIDVLALAGPNTKETQVGNKKRTCLVKAIMARTFEIALLVERQSSMPLLKGYWLDTAKSMIGDVAQPSCKIRPCPAQEIPDAPKSDFGLSHRIQVDVSESTSEDIQILKWALADLEEPVTSLGKAWGSEKYALIVAPNCVSGGTQPIPEDLWTSTLSLLVRLGVEDLTSRLARAAVFVWDLVDCPVHRGLGEASVIDLAEDSCRCPICVETWRRKTQNESTQDSKIEAPSECPPDEDLSGRSKEEKTSNLTEDPTMASQCFNLRLSAVDGEVALPTVESLKLRTIKTLAQLEDFRAIVSKHLSRAGISSAEVPELPQKILRREIERIISDSSELSASIAGALLEGNSSSTPRDLVLSTRSLIAQSFTSTSKAFVASLGGGRTDWIRPQFLAGKFYNGNYSVNYNYRLVPCRLFTVSAVDNPLFYFQDSENRPKPPYYEEIKYDSTAELSTRGQYGSAIWNLVQMPDIQST